MTTDLGYPVDQAIMLETLATLQISAPPRLRREVASIYARAVTKQLTGRVERPVTERGTEIGNTLTQIGVVELGQVLDTGKVAEVMAHFQACPVHPAHVATAAKTPAGTIADIRQRSHYGSYALNDILAAPHLLELANHPDLLSAASVYLGCVPSLYSMNCWWTFGGSTTQAPVAQRLHRDPDDYRFCTLFVFLTDVTDAASTHVFVTESHDSDRFDAEIVKRLKQGGVEAAKAQEMASLTYIGDGNVAPVDDMMKILFPERIRVLGGPAGSALLEDTYGLHRGTPQSTTDRLMFWARYGLGQNNSRRLDHLQRHNLDWQCRLPDTELTRYVNRMLIETR